MAAVKVLKVKEPITTISKRKSHTEMAELFGKDWYPGVDKVIKDIKKGAEEAGKFIGTKLGLDPILKPFKDTEQRIQGKAKGPAAKSLVVGDQGEEEDIEEE